MFKITLDEVGVVVGIATSIVGALYFIYLEIKKVISKYRARLQGSWINEGDVTIRNPLSHYMWFDFHTDLDDGEVSGEMSCRNQMEGDLENDIRLLIDGKLRYNSVKLSLYRIVDGKIRAMAKGRIKIKGKLIRWQLIKGDDNVFPTLMTLWPSES